jgi:hypothetical protein
MTDIVFKDLDKTQQAWFDAHPEDPKRNASITLAEELAGDPFAASWTRQVARPFLVENADGSVTFMRKAVDADEEKLYLRIQARIFLDLFAGNENAHYTYNSVTGVYATVNRGITLDDVVRHLSGIEPGLLSIPISAEPDGKFLTHFGVIDADRHGEQDEAIDHVDLAQLVTMHGLPLIVCKSKSPKSAHMPVFFKEEKGFSCALTRQMLQKWTHVLGITGEVDIFPRQSELEKAQIGSGVNLPYFGNSRMAFGEDGQELSLQEFLILAAKRRAFGLIVARRDLESETSGPRDLAPKDRKYGPMTRESIQGIHAKNLQELRDSNHAGHWNDIANNTAFFAAMAFAAKALEGTEKQIKDAIWETAAPDAQSKRQFETTLRSGWDSGITQPLKVVEIAASAIIKRPDMPESVLDG